MILYALGVDLEGNKEVLALRACAEEDKEGWLGVLQDLRSRGATQMDLIVTDGHDGLLAAVTELFPATPRQRCPVASDGREASRLMARRLHRLSLPSQWRRQWRQASAPCVRIRSPQTCFST